MLNFSEVEYNVRYIQTRNRNARAVLLSNPSVRAPAEHNLNGPTKNTEYSRPSEEKRNMSD